MADGNGIDEIFDTREDGLRCVRFVSGKVGVVDALVCEDGQEDWQGGRWR